MARAYVWSNEPELRGLEEAESVLSWRRRRHRMSRAQPPPPPLRPITPIVFVLLLSPDGWMDGFCSVRGIPTPSRLVVNGDKLHENATTSTLLREPMPFLVRLVPRKCASEESRYDSKV